MTNAFFKEVRGSQEVPREIAELLFLNIEILLSLLDGIACFLVYISIRNLVIPATVDLNFAALASKEMFCTIAGWAAQGEGETHCRVMVSVEELG